MASDAPCSKERDPSHWQELIGWLNLHRPHGIGSSVKPKLSFLFLAFSLSVLFGSLTCKAQSNSVVNLAGTSWVRSPQFIKAPGDGTIITLWHIYNFETNAKVKYTLITTKPAGVVEKMRSYNPELGDPTTKPTIPLFGSQTFNGTYEIEGKYIHLEFPAYHVWAEIYSDLIKGELADKNASKKEDWVVRRGTIQCEYTVPLCVSTAKQPSGNGKFSAPADSPMIGTWKEVEYSDKGEVIRTETLTFSPNGVVEGIHQRGANTHKSTRNWKYTAKSAASGVLKIFWEDELILRGNVKFLGGNKFFGRELEFTVTFTPHSHFIGDRAIWIKQ